MSDFIIIKPEPWYKDFSKALFLVAWVTGVIIAKGFWSTFFAFICPFWGWYLIIESLLIHYGVI
jgi:hypothetical protein